MAVTDFLGEPYNVPELYIMYGWRYFFEVFFVLGVSNFIFPCLRKSKNQIFLAIFRDQGIKTPNFVSVTLLWFCDAFQRTGGALYRTGDASQMIGGSKDMDSVALQMTSLCRTPGKIWEEFSTQSMSRIFF